ncbi:unnamed protein product [Phytophthora fragariaefolia]|uniref:Unnamed protein product n=1 Tax=Phytophthora fragariaefolia TaxID=1490495 RepID=A0A9W6XJL3_9STRA|nr:unnamed protein product [Phytophthora fragariaefolia]
MDGEVTRRGGLVEVTSGDDLAEDDGDLDDLEDKAPIAFGDPARSMDEVADAISDSGSEDDIEMNDTAASFRRSTRTRWPNARYRDNEVELPMSLVIETVNSLMDPETVDDALSGPDAETWIEALQKEYGDLMRNNTWELVERPKDKKVLTGKWVLVQKRDAHGNVVRHRARITIKGCQQRYGIDYWETYAPVVSQESKVYSADSATLWTLLSPFAVKPVWVEAGSIDMVQTLDKHLRSCGFHRLKMDGDLYVRTVGGSPVFVSVYVDDLVIAGTDDNIKLVMQGLRAKFEIKDLGPVTDLLHMEISYVPDQVLWISQRGYIDKLLKRFGMESCRPVTTPQAVGNLPDPVDDDQRGVNDPNIPYRELVGGLQYLVQGTRPDIANAVLCLQYTGQLPR